MTRPVALLLFIVFCLSAGCAKPDRIVVGSKNFTEQVILGELLAQEIERKTTLPVDRRLNLGGTLICHDGITSGQLDLYVEYTGTALTAILKEAPISNAAQVYEKVKAAYRSQFNVEWTEPLGFNNTFAMLIRDDDAQRLHLKTISDAAPYTKSWTAGFGYEFVERPDGFQGLSKTYGLQFAGPPKVMDLGLTYRALAGGQVDMIAGNSTDGTIEALKLFPLADDKGYFPPYDAAPLIRTATLKAHPELRAVLAGLQGKISDADMRRLNFAVDGDRRDVAQVVKQFLDSKGL